MGKFSFGEEDFEVAVKVPAKREKQAAAPKAPKTAMKRQSKPVIQVAVKPKNVSYGGTQGRAGMKLPRINMAFDPANYEYIRRESSARGLTMSAFVNTVLEEYRSDPSNVHYDPNI